MSEEKMSSLSENEVEILQSRVLVRNAVKSLKLYTEYFNIGYLRNLLIYKNQPINVEIDPESLNRMDRMILDDVRTIDMVIKPTARGYSVEGNLYSNGKKGYSFSQELYQFPASINTRFGVLTFTTNKSATEQKISSKGIKVIIAPPMMVAKKYLARMSVAPTSKLTTIAEITLKDENAKRGIDFLLSLANCYNLQANTDKNEIALKTEEFINDRINKINEELGSTEGTLEEYKKRHAVTQLDADAAQSLQMSSQYGNKLAEANSQIQLLDYLREFIDNPHNQYKIIPSNVGMSDQASTALIANYNQTVQDRSRLLKVASEQAPQVLTLTATLDELQNSIRTALLQARRTADINRQSIQSQYAKYQNRIGSTPEQERVLTEIGRQQEVRSGLYLILLQEREENSISLAATADKGKLIDEPQYGGKVSPKTSIILLAALIIGGALPIGIILLLQFFRYRLEGRDELEKLTCLPIIADIPMASEAVKDSSGIVVKATVTEVCCYVCRADYTPKADIDIVNTLAKESKLPNTCVILNAVDMSKKKYGYYYGYGKYGRYGHYGKYGYGQHSYGHYGNYDSSHYSNQDDDSIKR